MTDLIAGKRAVSAWLVTLIIVAVGCGPVSPVATPVPTNTAPAPTAEATPTEMPTPAIAPTLAPTLAPTQTTGPEPSPTGTVNLTGYTWKQVGLPGTKLTGVGVAGQGTDMVVAAGPAGAWHSRYDYTTWEQYDVSLDAEAQRAELSVASSDVIYVATHTGCASGLPIALMHTTDSGRTWQQASGESGEVLRVAASSHLVAYGATCIAVVKTTDSGATWEELPGSRVTNFEPLAIAASPNGELVYAIYASEGGSGRVMMSSDEGRTWQDVTPTNAPDNEFRAAAHAVFVPGSVGRPDDGGLYMVNDQGFWFLPLESTDWHFVQHEGTDPTSATGYFVSALYVDTHYTEDYDKPGPVIYTARQSREGRSLGVYRSTDLGRTWQLVGKDLSEARVNDLVLVPQDDVSGSGRVETLIAATDDGVWALPMPPPFR